MACRWLPNLPSVMATLFFNCRKVSTQIMRVYVLKSLIGEGVRCYDFLGGVDPSKARWGAKTGTYLDLHFAVPCSRGSIYLQLKHRAQESKQRLREIMPPRAWSLLHSVNMKLRG